jgi:hypothetical protein
MNPNATWSTSLESYHPYLQPQKVSKNPLIFAFTIAYPKMKKFILAALVL